jgi:death-on-curing protein
VTRYLSLAEYFWLAEQVTRTPADVLVKASRSDLARRVGSAGDVIDLNGGRWQPDPPDVDDAETAMLAVAAHDVDQAWLAAWIERRVTFDDE